MIEIETREWTYRDKSEWGHGEWQDEPDKMQWQDEETGLACLIVRGPSGALCGYVGLKEDHPYYKMDYNDCYKEAYKIDEYIECHGGLTYASLCAPHEDNPELGVCHVVHPDVPAWWLGFDCAHSGDAVPSYKEQYGQCDYYKNIRYVKNNVTQLAKQLKEIGDGD